MTINATTMKCAKCLRQQPSAEACIHCGLLRENFAQYQKQNPFDPELMNDWSQLKDAWQQEAKHEEFYQKYANTPKRSQITALYTSALEQQDTRDQAARQLEKLRKLAIAVASMGLVRKEKEKRNPWFTAVAILVFFVVLVVVALLLLRNTEKPEKQRAGQKTLSSLTGESHWEK